MNCCGKETDGKYCGNCGQRLGVDAETGPPRARIVLICALLWGLAALFWLVIPISLGDLDTPAEVILTVVSLFVGAVFATAAISTEET